MTSKGATKDYKYGQKNNWRRAIWNELLRRTDGREKDEPILYLAGPQDLDREIARQKGVPDSNLIAVDTSLANVKKVRAKGGLAIQADVGDVLWSWPEDRRVCVVFVDYCSGLEHSIAATFDAFQRKPLRRAVCAINFMRGRDPWSNEWRKMLRLAGLLAPLWVFQGGSNEPKLFYGNTKSRAYQFLLFHALDMFSSLHGKGSANSQQIGDDGVSRSTFLFPPDDDAGRAEYQFHISNFLLDTKPKFFSYASRNLRFDSAVFEHPSRHLETSKSMIARIAKRAAEHEVRAISGRYKVDSAARKIAATLAVRTRRMAP